jgi:glutaredoxin
VAEFELYGTAGCPYTREMREWLEWNRREYVEFDVESDAAARERMRAIDKSVRTVPVLVQDGKIVQIGFGGRGCIVA